jgi:hypothetical protein
LDQAQLLALAKQTVALITPMIAAGALVRLDETSLDAAAATLKQLWPVLQRRLAGDAEAEAALRLYQARPEASARQELLVEQIAARFVADTAAIAELHALVQRLQSQTNAPATGRTHSIVAGGNAQIGTAVAGDVYGGLTVGPTDFSKKTIVTGPRGGAPAPTATAAAPAMRPALPATLSADGAHFSYGHALLIGVGAYQHGDLSVDTTSADAVALAELLRNPQVAGASQATAVVFFAGHGKAYRQGYYLLPHDYTSTDVAASAISAAEFHQKIDAIRRSAQKLIVLLNCCHSGGVGDAVLDDTTGESTGDTPPADFYQPLVAGGGQVVISAARPWQKAGAASSAAPEHTVFGARLLDALRGHAPGEGAGIGVFELFSYLSAQVPADARQITYKNAPLAQEPLLYAHQLDQNIAVALRPGWQGGTLSEDLNELIRQFAEAEVALAGYEREDAAPAELLQRRAALLERLEHEA